LPSDERVVGASDWQAAFARAAMDWDALQELLGLDAEFGRVMRDLTEEKSAIAQDALRQAAQEFGPTMIPWVLEIITEVVAAPESQPTLAKQVAGLSCGQVFAITIILLSVALFMDLPTEVQDKIVSLIAVLGVAYGAILRVAKK
jgi:hypothetical protein